MKKIFAFAIALVSMAAVMTSCNNDEADYVMQPAQNTYTNNSNNGNTQSAEDLTEQVVEIFLPVTDVQLEVMDIEISFSMPDRTTTITPEQMTEVEFPARVPDNDAVGTAKLLKFRVPGTFTMAELKKAAMGRTAKVNEEGVAKYQDQSINMFLGYTCTVTEVGKEAQVNINNFKYTSNVDMSNGKYFEKLMSQYQFSGEMAPVIYTVYF